MDKVKVGRNGENVLVIIILFVILLFITPIIMNVFYKSNVRGAYISTVGLVNALNNAYMSESLKGVFFLPFEIRYKNNKYTAYSNGQETSIEIKTEGRTPDEGSIILTEEGNVIIKELKYGNIVCNKKDLNSEITCK